MTQVKGGWHDKAIAVGIFERGCDWAVGRCKDSSPEKPIGALFQSRMDFDEAVSSPSKRRS
jgi:hypothetical protein